MPSPLICGVLIMTFAAVASGLSLLIYHRNNNSATRSRSSRSTIQSSSSSSSSRRCGAAAMPGRRNGQPKVTQDSALMLPASGLVGVLDGHGPLGHVIAHWLCSNFAIELQHQMTKAQQQEQQQPYEPSIVLRRTVETLHDALCQEQIEQTEFSGSTLCMVWYTRQMLWTCNVGDSRAVLYSPLLGWKSRADEVVPIAQTQDHNPGLESERLRILQAGGQVGTDKWGNVYMMASHGNGPSMSVSRSLGDQFMAKRKLIIATPDIQAYYLNTQKEQENATAKKEEQKEIVPWFAVIGTDGLFAEFSTSVIGQLAWRYRNEADCGAQRLVDQARHNAEWRCTLDPDSDQDYIDDITAAVVWFRSE